MKTIEIEGMKHEVPNWVNYITMDLDGEWWGFEAEPSINYRAGGKWRPHTNRFLKIYDGTPWNETMRKV